MLLRRSKNSAKSRAARCNSRVSWGVIGEQRQARRGGNLLRQLAQDLPVQGGELFQFCHIHMFIDFVNAASNRAQFDDLATEWRQKVAI